MHKKYLFFTVPFFVNSILLILACGDTVKESKILREYKFTFYCQVWQKSAELYLVKSTLCLY